MALVNIKEMLEKARKEHYAVGAFDASTIEMAMAIVEAAEEEKSPVIVMGLTPDLQQGKNAYLLDREPERFGEESECSCMSSS